MRSASGEGGLADHGVPWSRSLQRYSLKLTQATQVQIGDGVEDLVEDDPLLDRAPAHHSLADIAGLLQHAHRRRVVRERDGEDACEAEGLEPIVGERLYGGSGDTPAPHGLAEPVPYLSRAALDVAL